MVKRYEFDLYAGGMVDDCPDGFYVLHSDYAALQASHARLLREMEQINALYSYDATVLELAAKCYDAKTISARAIAAAQPFTET